MFYVAPERITQTKISKKKKKMQSQRRTGFLSVAGSPLLCGAHLWRNYVTFHDTTSSLCSATVYCWSSLSSFLQAFFFLPFFSLNSFCFILNFDTSSLCTTTDKNCESLFSFFQVANSYHQIKFSSPVFRIAHGLGMIPLLLMFLKIDFLAVGRK